MSWMLESGRGEVTGCTPEIIESLGVQSVTSENLEV